VPSIVTQPSGATKNVGQSVTFSVAINADVAIACEPWPASVIPYFHSIFSLIIVAGFPPIRQFSILNFPLTIEFDAITQLLGITVPLYI